VLFRFIRYQLSVCSAPIIPERASDWKYSFPVSRFMRMAASTSRDVVPWLGALVLSTMSVSNWSAFRDWSMV